VTGVPPAVRERRRLGRPGRRIRLARRGFGGTVGLGGKTRPRPGGGPRPRDRIGRRGHRRRGRGARRRRGQPPRRRVHGPQPVTPPTRRDDGRLRADGRRRLRGRGGRSVPPTQAHRRLDDGHPVRPRTPRRVRRRRRVRAGDRHDVSVRGDRGGLRDDARPEERRQARRDAAGGETPRGRRPPSLTAGAGRRPNRRRRARGSGPRGL